MRSEGLAEGDRRRDRLGRGLGALLGDYPDSPSEADNIRRVSLRTIVPNPLQPRKEFSPEDLASLTDSIRENGLLQPLVVRPSSSAPGRYELVAGERRFRAITRLNWEDVPVVVRDVDDQALLVLALVENLQRAELNPLEEAEGYQTLMSTFGLTQAEVATSVGKNRSTVANILRLLKLPPSVRSMLQDGKLSAGHARALVTLEDSGRISELARRAVSEGWSVREIERQVRGKSSGASSKASSSSTLPSADPIVKALESELREVLSTKVAIRQGAKGAGSIEIPYHSSEDFERIFAMLAGKEVSEVLD